MLIDPAKTPPRGSPMKERVAADAASTAGRLATRFQYVTRIEISAVPGIPALASGLLAQYIVINDFALALLA
jgi:hypothetical protein